jgi:endonuclease/exonuclease/phosphatase family metal-dependent hydrolase
MRSRLLKPFPSPALHAIMIACYIGNFASQANATNSLTLLTYNIHAGVPLGKSSGKYAATLQDLRNVADVITTSAADIVALQEVKCDWGCSKPETLQTLPADIPRVLACLTGHNFAFASTLDDTAGFPGNTAFLQWGTCSQWTNNNAVHGEFGNGILARKPMTAPAQSIALPKANAEEQRGCLRAEWSDAFSGFGAIVVYATHLENTTATARYSQMKAILSRASMDSTTATVFILGDLNYFPQPGEEDLIALVSGSGFHDLAADYARLHSAPADFTFPSDTPNRRIDYILCSKPLPVDYAATLCTQASDHLPLVVRVTPLPPAP